MYLGRNAVRYESGSTDCGRQPLQISVVHETIRNICDYFMPHPRCTPHFVYRPIYVVERGDTQREVIPVLGRSIIFRDERLTNY